MSETHSVVEEPELGLDPESEAEEELPEDEWEAEEAAAAVEEPTEGPDATPDEVEADDDDEEEDWEYDDPDGQTHEVRDDGEEEAEEEEEEEPEPEPKPKSKSKSTKSKTKTKSKAKSQDQGKDKGKGKGTKKTTDKKGSKGKTKPRQTSSDNGDRRARGLLEHDVMLITRDYEQGKIELEEGETLTPHRVATILQDRDDLEKRPSTGAISNIFAKWGEIGYANLHRKPLAFKGVSARGKKEGLDSLKEKAAAKAKRERAKEKSG